PPQNSYADVVARVAPAVVTIHANKRVRRSQQFPFLDDPSLRDWFGDQPRDLAVLKVTLTSLPFLTPGDSDKVRVGDVALAIGNPLDVGQTVTMGIISAKGRSTPGTGSGNFEDFLQTDAPINRGNSGGALVNTNGDLIGINSQIIGGLSGGNIGIGFAIP